MALQSTHGHRPADPRALLRNRVLHRVQSSRLGNSCYRPPLFQYASQRRPSRTSATAKDRVVSAPEDLDSVVLDDAYYKEMGMSKQDIEDQQALAADDIDPEAEDFKLEDLFSPREGTPQEIIDAYFNKDIYGPEARSLAYIVLQADLPTGSQNRLTRHKLFLSCRRSCWLVSDQRRWPW